MRFPKFLAALLAVGWLATAVPAFAADQAPTGCNCWCTSKAGATSAGQSTTTAECATTCKDKGEKVIVCSKKAGELPANNLRCFENEDACKLNCEGPPLPNAKPSGYIYDKDYQPTECPAKYHYCYCTGESYQLAYKIPNPDPSKPPIGEVADLGAYVNTVYKYLLGISGLVAIVMIMIGGVQYVTSVGGGSISAAKERIQNAVIGLILLFCAALILQTVNPRLLTLQPPRLPSVKRIEIVDANSNCYELAKKGYQIEGYNQRSGAEALTSQPLPPEKPCGTKAVVLKDKAGTDVTEGTVCTFKGCADDTEGCFISGDKAQCIACKAAVPTNETGLIPTSAVCKQLGENMKPVRDTEHPYCFWTKDPSMLLGPTEVAKITAVAGVTAGGALLAGPAGAAIAGGVALSATDVTKLRYGTCAELRIDCANLPLVRIAGQSSDSYACESYNTNKLTAYGLASNELYDLAPGWGDMDMKKVCELDPCKMAKSNGKCVFAEADNTCITPILGQGATSDGCNDDTNCNSGICNTAGINQCVTAQGSPAGEPCVRDRDCGLETAGPGNRDRTCNLNDGTINGTCVKDNSLANGEKCDKPQQCVSTKCGGGGTFTSMTCQP